ncbi:3-deoxy-7-phosphoheptulonate synthase [Candidatus Gracilibacteria bacterium]|nr:3-deoxy-7-phosphoheptulonate synthase [Candidatus Gracilibacteria bacterium]
MGFSIRKTLPSHSHVKDKLPLNSYLIQKIEQDREEIKKILRGEDQRKLLIIGPCSAWPLDSVVEYAKWLKPLSDRVGDKIKVVVRTYIQKPRTTVGWQGSLVQPDPFSDPDAEEGIFKCRQMMIDVIQAGLPIADEILFPRSESYFRDLLSWAAVGARSTENQEHRILASMLEMPIGMKNPTSGNVKIGVNSVLAAQTNNYLAIKGEWVETSGNPYAHLVLRGGSGKPNYHLCKLQKALKYFQEHQLQNPTVIVDASHDNCLGEDGKKYPENQIKVIEDVLTSMQEDPNLTPLVKGFMVESFLHHGCQKINNGTKPEEVIPGLSITDPCLGTDDTEKLIVQIYENL